MSAVTDSALNRLVSILPLAQRQAALPPTLRTLHQVLLRSLVDRGRELTIEETADAAPGHDALDALWTLSSLDLIVLDDGYRTVGAYPLTTERTPHEVTVNGHAIWAMCALDALAVAPMFDAEVAIRSHCPMTGAEIAVTMKGSRLLSVSPGSDVQVGVWWRDPGAVAARTLCRGVVFLRDKAAAERWRSGWKDHDVVRLAEAAEVAARFFEPLMAEPGIAAHAGA